MSVEQMEKWP
jgi:hypothetical protein